MPADANKIREIKCTQCAAPLTLHGGRKVRSITCSYCGSVLDTREEYKAITKFLERQRPPSPFELGMTGKLKDVEFTIIGLVQYQSDDLSRWLEYLLFSPTHGYAWLEMDSAHFVFSRRVRDLPKGPVLSAKAKQKFQARGRTFRFYERYVAKIVYVEGELTWLARAGDSVTLADGIDPPFIYTVEKTANEQEYSFGEYLEPEEVYGAFKLNNDPFKRNTVHPAQPYRASPAVTDLSRSALYFLPFVALMTLWLFVFSDGKQVLTGSVQPQDFRQGRTSTAFQVSDPDKLMALELDSPLDNAWALFDIGVQKDGADIFSMSKQISYYSGYEGGEHWSEGSQSAKAYFKVPAAGNYTLYITGEGGTGNRGTQPQGRALHYTVKEGVVVSRYFFILTILLGIGTLWRHLSRWRFEARRWADGEDDDDD